MVSTPTTITDGMLASGILIGMIGVVGSLMTNGALIGSPMTNGALIGNPLNNGSPSPTATIAACMGTAMMTIGIRGRH